MPVGERAAGLAEAQGEIICYLDDDAVAEPGWLEQVARAFDEHPAVGVVGGMGDILAAMMQAEKVVTV